MNPMHPSMVPMEAVTLQPDLEKDLANAIEPLRKKISRMGLFDTAWLARNRESDETLFGTIDGAPNVRPDSAEMRAHRRTLLMAVYTVKGEYLLTVIPILKHKGNKARLFGFLWTLELPDKVLMANTPALPFLKLSAFEWKTYPYDEREGKEVNKEKDAEKAKAEEIRIQGEIAKVKAELGLVPSTGLADEC